MLRLRLLIILLVLALLGISEGKIVYVPDSYSTIQQAVNAVSDGDTVIVRDGIYVENIKVNKSLIIKSENSSANCTVKAEYPYNPVFEISANYVSIVGFTVEGATGFSAGIFINASYCNISNNNVKNNWDGIYLKNSSNSKISNNICFNNEDDGIFLWYSNNNTIINNNCSNNGDSSISLWASNSNTISNNNIHNSWDGIWLYNSNNNKVTKNNCSDNWDGVRLWKSISNEVSSNKCYNNEFGIWFWYSNNNKITKNNCFNNGNGIRLSDSSNNSITKNSCLGNWDGIHLEYSNYNTIYLNNFINNVYNVYSYKSTNIWNSTKRITYTYEGKTYTNYLGNYYSDYKGKDANKDGIGDTPHNVGVDEDNYPLEHPYGNIKDVSK